MPGLVGFTRTANEDADAVKQVASMREIITHRAFYRQDDVFADERVAGSRSHPGVIQLAPQPHAHNGTFIWLDGEFYNRSELNRKHQTSADNDPMLLAKLYEDDPDLKFLDSINGVFAAVIYDQPRRLLHLISDRNGLQHLYWGYHAGRLVWASEIKGFLALPDFTPRIDRQALDDFLRFGYMLGDRTWFEGVELLPPATVLTYDIASPSIRKSRYWSWDRIQPMTGPLDLNEMADEAGRLLRQAVHRCIDPGEPLGLWLSGGFDSRVLLAALPPETGSVHAYTFGIADSEEMIIARKLAELAEVEHHRYHMNAENWLNGRLDGVWWADGQCSLLHMHGIARTDDVLFESIQKALNGFGGDPLLGGTYLQDGRFSETEKHENRGRRFIIHGPRLHRVFFQPRIPFVDRDFANLALAVPAKYRREHFFYMKMINRCFHEWFDTIPVDKGRKARSHSYPLHLARRKANWLRRSIRRRMGSAARGRGSNNTTDYAAWFRSEPARSHFDQLVHASDAAYPSYIDPQRVREEWRRVLEGQGNVERMGRYLTFEIWINQVQEPMLRADTVLAAT